MKINVQFDFDKHTRSAIAAQIGKKNLTHSEGLQFIKQTVIATIETITSEYDESRKESR